MAKYYVRSGQVRHIVTALSPLAAAVKAFQWTCDQQVEMDVPSSVELIVQAERAGCLMGDEVHVSERGFVAGDQVTFDTNLVVDHWQHRTTLPEVVVPRWVGTEAVA